LVAYQHHGNQSSNIIIMNNESEKSNKKLNRSFSDTTADSRHNSYVYITPGDEKSPRDHETFEFDKFVNADSGNNAYANKKSNYINIDQDRSRDSSIHFHTGYSIPISSSQSVIINNTVVLNDKAVVERKQPHVLSPLFIKQASVMSLWFIFSFISIVLNKYILSILDVDPGILGLCQIVMTTFFGCCMMYIPFGRCHSIKHASSNDYFNKYQFFKTMCILGWLRFGSIICSIIGLKYVAVSFSETIKSSAPLFTAIVAYFLLGEYSGIYVNLSLIPIMSGLAITTSNEISFNMTGFLAAISNNILDCIQNVFSKKLLSSEDHRFSPLELQFYTSVSATIIQLPFWFLLMDMHQKIKHIDQYKIGVLLLNGVIFYAQSLFAYSLMSLISPITFSVSNTVKRAGLIWFSVIVFGNEVTFLGAFGTFLVVFGVFLYQRARHVEALDRKLVQEQKTNPDKTDG